MEQENKDVRIDRWLWAVRIFKSRSLATEACRAGHIKIDGKSVKPSHSVKIGEIVTVQIGELTKTLKVKGLLEQRVGAKIAVNYVEDITPPEEYEKLKKKRETMPYYREPGLGRPTKRERRLMKKYGLI